MSSSSVTLKSNGLLKLSVKICFGVVVAGQLVFALYIIGLYGLSSIAGDWVKWNTAAPHGYVAGDLKGNIVFGIHMLFAAIITLGGPLQLMAQVRKRFAKFHRVNGRIYIISAFLISFAGLYLAWVRESVGGVIGAVFISVNALIIMVCAYYTVRRAMGGQLKDHRQWAIRLFLSMSGVWFFRILLMFWISVNQGIVGFDNDTFQGPALNALYIICYICPVIVLEGYFKVIGSQSVLKIRLFTLFVFVMILCIVVGSLAATLGMWLPNL